MSAEAPGAGAPGAGAPGGAGFARATGVEALGDGAYAAELDAGWRIGAALNGGYLLATVARGMGRVATHAPDPLAVSAYYASAAAPGAATVRTRVVREGGSSAVLGAELVQATADGTEEVRLSALATYGVLAREPDPAAGPVPVAPPADLPPPEDCVGPADVAPAFAREAPFVERFEMRMDPTSAGWLRGAPSGRGVQQGWLRLADGAAPDPWLLLLVLDALPPVTYDLGLPGWAPTLELTAHVRAHPEPGWLAVRHETRTVAGGLFEEDSAVWDSSGRLVAQGRQLARTPRPPRG
ncbi:thioesterase family protein [Nocardioides lentus]|uniref:Thioesterase family protein n=1 Tax=Nocardioides lentus TaxID=338077 RepID=A0ABP5API2_9ACTN